MFLVRSWLPYLYVKGRTWLTNGWNNLEWETRFWERSTCIHFNSLRTLRKFIQQSSERYNTLLVPWIVSKVERNFDELLRLGVLRKAAEEGEVFITTSVGIGFHDGKSILCGDFRALNTYNVPEIYPLPQINQALNKLRRDVFITKLYVMKGFNRNILERNITKILSITYHLEIFEYVTTPFGIKNAPLFFSENGGLKFFKRT